MPMLPVVRPAHGQRASLRMPVSIRRDIQASEGPLHQADRIDNTAGARVS